MTTYIFPLRAYIEDTDCGGIVYHANYLNYFERARSEWAEELGWGLEWQKQQNIFFVIRHVHIDYYKPVRAHDKLEVVTRIRTVRNASVVYEQHLRPASANDTILCKADIRIACVNNEARPKTLPNWLKTRLNDLIAET